MEILKVTEANIFQLMLHIIVNITVKYYIVITIIFGCIKSKDLFTMATSKI